MTAAAIRREFSVPVAMLAVFFFVIALSGGASRASSNGQLVVRLAAIVFGAIALAKLDRSQFAAIRLPLYFIAAMFCLLVAQLIPLPPSVWSALPGRSGFALSDNLLWDALPWRPLALQPDLAINSMLSLLPGLSAILLFGLLPPNRRSTIAWTIAALGLASGILGLAQISTGNASLYLYRISGFGTSTGLFANRNHQAALLAMTLPAIATLANTALLRGRAPVSAMNKWLGLGVAAFVLVLLIATGSRTGLVLALVGLGGAWLIAISGAKVIVMPQKRKTSRIPWLSTVWIGGLMAVGITIVLSRSQAMQRIFNEDVALDIRVSLLRPIWEIGMIYFPFGVGFGSFVDIFKMHQTISSLDIKYLNHAHNDFLELYVEGGVAGLLLLGVFLLWWLGRFVAVWRDLQRGGRQIALARLASVMTAIALIGSLSDYPLRTPIMSVIFALSCCLMAQGDPVRHRMGGAAS